MPLQRAQEVQNVLLLLYFQLVELFDHPDCLAAGAAMVADRFKQIAGPSIMEKENPLPHAPERSRSKLIWPRSTLRDAVRQSPTHVVDQEIGKEIHRLIG